MEWQLNFHQSTLALLCSVQTLAEHLHLLSAFFPVRFGVPFEKLQFIILLLQCLWFFCALTLISQCRWTSFTAITRWWAKSSKRKLVALVSMFTPARLIGQSSNNRPCSFSTCFSSFLWRWPSFRLFILTSNNWATVNSWELSREICSLQSPASLHSTFLQCLAA